MKNFLLGAMATVLCAVLLGANYQEPESPKQHEYQVYTHRTGISTLKKEGVGGVIQDRLNEEAAKGWIPIKIGVYMFGQHEPRFYSVLRREKE